MITVEKYIQIKPHRHESSFEQVNKDTFSDVTLLLGTTNSSIRDFRLNSSLIANVMPMALGISPDVKDVNWNKDVLKWLLDFSIPIGQEGFTFNCSFVFDIDNPEKKEAIAEFKERHKTKLEKSSKDAIEKYMAEKAMNFTDDAELCYKVGMPVDPEHYIKYRLASYNALVAKAFSLIEPNHTFYVYNKEDEDKAKAKLYTVKKAAQASFAKLIADPNSTNTMVALLCQFDDSNIDYLADTKSSTGRLIIEQKLDELVSSKSELFNKFMEDGRLETKFLVRTLLYNNILTYLEGSMAISDATNKDFVIGTTIDEATSWFLNPDNEVKANAYRVMINKK